jgi:hypothetical protein
MFETMFPLSKLSSDARSVPEADERKALINLATAYEHYNVNPPRRALESPSLREYWNQI